MGVDGGSKDIKSNIKQQEIRDLVTASHKLLQDVPSKFQMQCTEGVYFSFDFSLVRLP